MSKALYTRKTFYTQPTDFRIGAIVSDGMWYSLPKWRKLARCEEDELQEWIARHTASGDLEQSATGAKSYRFLLPAIRKWYHEHGYSLENDQLIDFLFPPRIWDNQTENDGFLAAPLRTVSIVSFTADSKTASAVQEGLRGVARVREVSPGKYKAYGLEPSHINAGINEVAKELGQTIKTYTRSEASRRELVDFTPAFANSLVLFYRQFGHTLVKPMMDTIRIFIPDPEDQESQIVIWVLTAIEKFDESSSVPFSGYLNSVLRRWPYDLPAMYLGKELSAFQRERSRALKALAEEAGGKTIPNEKIAETLGLKLYDFLELEEKHRAWVRSQTATTLAWDENADEKSVESNLSGDLTAGAGDTDVELANRISIAVIQAALETQDFASSYFLISQIDTAELDLGNIRTLSAPFVAALAKNISG